MDAIDQLSMAIEASKTNDKALNELIEAYKPFIASELSKRLNRHVNPDSDEMMSIGMLAFVEAVRAYDLSKGSFLGLASRIIQQRVIDYYRKEGRRKTHNSFDETTLELQNKSMDIYYAQINRADMQHTINEFKEALALWQIDLLSLAKVSPKNDKRKELCKAMAKYIHEDSVLYEDIRQSQKLPIQLLAKKFGIQKKKIERSRQFIIACIIMMEDRYESLSDYVK
jgi:RNA polymerase sigma factor